MREQHSDGEPSDAVGDPFWLPFGEFKTIGPVLSTSKEPA